ncbi:biliverdin-producing heme oxygenase [Streptomyces sp. NPDC002588]|uniref:biliverdin-producing heme oxygenase n=1 Tax=Streptomyces sp. NPDC002588 TaxID=3154419 RepID=UPI0033347AC5
MSTSARFSEALKSVTWDDHEKAEHTEYMRAMLAGKLDISAHASLLAQYYFVYVALEEAAEAMRDDPVGGKFVFDSLMRTEALEEDLEYLLGAAWRDQIEPLEATKEYVARLREVCFDWPGGYIAHSYTRYLGDLSGGQVIRASLERAFPDRLANGTGVAFYLFPEIPEIEDVRAFKADYRLLLDAVEWSDETRQKVIGEVLLAYRVNMKVLAELGRGLPRHLLDKNQKGRTAS